MEGLLENFKIFFEKNRIPIDSKFLIGVSGGLDSMTTLSLMIESKLEEAKESGVYSGKDLADLLQMAHKMRMDEIKAQAELEKAQATNVRSQTNIQVNEGVPFGQGNYGKLMEKLLTNV